MKSSNFRHYSFMLGIAIIVYPLWWMPYHLWDARAYNPFLFRLVLTLAAAATIVAGRFWPFVKAHMELIFLAFAGAATAHHLWLTYVNQMNPVFTTSLLIILTATLAALKSQKLQWAYGFFALLLTAYVLKESSPEFSRSLYFTTVLTLMAVEYLGMSSGNKAMTDLVEAQEALKLSQLSIVQTARLASLGEMAGGIAHEINNPLAIIHGKAGQLKELSEAGAADPMTVTEMAARIETTAQRIAAIVNGLRDFSRSGSADPFMKADVWSIIDETLALCREKFHAKEIRIDCDVPRNVFISCRGIQIGQALLNLFANAYDAVAELPVRWLRVNVTTRDSKVEITVTDSGPGIPADLREKIMHPFFTTKPIGSGTGLGLSISKGLVESHGGRLYLDTRSENTKFVMELPLVNEAAA